MAKKAKKNGKAKKSTKTKVSAKSAKASNGASTRGPDAIKLLKQDHRAVEDLFEDFESAKKAADKRSIAREICMELTIHTMIEEELFYPAVKGVVEDELYGEAHVEHDGAKVLIAEILAAQPSDEFYDARVKVLSEMIKHHVKEEEQADGMFAQAKDSDIDLKELGDRMEQRKEDLKRLMQRNGIPAPEARTMQGAEVKLGQPVA